MLANEIALGTNGATEFALEFGRSPQVDDRTAIEVGRLLEDVRRSLNHDLIAAKTSAARLAAFLAGKFPHDGSPSIARGGLAPWRKRKVQDYIQHGLAGPLLVADMARLVSLSPSYFCRAFKESFGEPPHAYLIKMRVERARTLMRTTSDSLSQIALACGLADQAHLCRCFRQVTGATPGAWRRRLDPNPPPNGRF